MEVNICPIKGKIADGVMKTCELHRIPNSVTRELLLSTPIKTLNFAS